MFSQLPETEWTVEKAAHLLNRAAFGGPPEDIINLYNMGLEKAVDTILTNNTEKDSLDLLTPDRFSAIVPIWLEEMQKQQYNYRDKLALFWHGTLPAEKQKDPESMWAFQYTTVLRDVHLQCYSDVLKAIFRCELLSKYLNLNGSCKKFINENFARELLELFTLG